MNFNKQTILNIAGRIVYFALGVVCTIAAIAFGII